MKRRAIKHHIMESLKYRVPMPITERSVYWNGNGYYICPRCHVTLEREFSAYCDRCGQCLNWSGYKEAKQIYAEQH